MRTSILAIEKGNYRNSIGERLVVWQAGYELAIAKPILGYGPANVTKVMAEGTINARRGPRRHTHFHNSFLNEMIRAGIVGLATLLGVFIVPILVVLKAPRSVEAHQALKIIIGTQIVYMMSGLTGIMLGHDITDSLYLCVVTFCIYLAYPLGKSPNVV